MKVKIITTYNRYIIEEVKKLLPLLDVSLVMEAMHNAMQRLLDHIGEEVKKSREPSTTKQDAEPL